MKNVSRFFFSLILSASLLASSVAFAIVDKDGDGFPLAVSAGQSHTCAIDNNGVHCWGSNSDGQTIVPILMNPIAISAGGWHSCALDDMGMHCWGDDYIGQSTVPPLSNPVAIATGDHHTCALDDTDVHCWGDNHMGQSTVPSLQNPAVVAAGGDHTCALDDNGVHCWGYNGSGQTTVPALVNPVAVSAGYFHTCAIDDNGVHCWGYNSEGQTTVPALDNPIAVSAGYSHTCALDDNGVHCWGDNHVGQTTVPALVNPVAISVGGWHSCALDDTGVHCWGGYDESASAVPLLVVDNCPAIANPDQHDADFDGIGDVCDSRPDGSSADRRGAEVAFAGDFNGDGFNDYVIGIPGYDIPAIGLIQPVKKNAGRALVISGKDGSLLSAINGVAAKDAMGFAVAGGGDIDGDGYDDVVVGAPNAGKNHAGSVTILFGPAGAPIKTINPYNGGHARFGAAVALGDVIDDPYGLAEIIVGAPKFDHNFNNKKIITDTGAVILISRNADLDGINYEERKIYYGATAKAYAGTSVAVADIDKDGQADIIIGAPNDEDTTGNLKNTGSVSVYEYDYIYQYVNSSAQLLKKYGTAAKAYFGNSVASGDVNKDGYVDVIVGAPGFDNGKLIDAGSVSVISGANGSVLTTQFSIVAKAGLGNSVAAGDVNGDGYADIIAGAAKDDSPTIPKITKDTGSVSIWSGNGYAQIGSTLYGGAAKDYFGSSVGAGDINGDGKADLIIGVPGKDIPPAAPAKIIKDAGAVKVISGATIGL